MYTRILLAVILLTAHSALAIRKSKSAGEDSSQTSMSAPDDYMSGLKLTSLSISADSGADSILKFDNGASTSLILALLAETGSFIIKNEQITIMEAKDTGDLIFRVNRVQTKNIEFSGDLLYQDIPQWKLAVSEDYWNAPTGWNIADVTTCGGVNMLGGYGILSKSNLTKEFRGLPEHTKLRIVVSFHFIDAWTGESAFLKADVGRDGALEFLWSDRYDSSDAEKDINICGSSYGEGKFNSLIDVTIPHDEESINLAFATTNQQDPETQSWGISGLQIYII